MDLVCFDLVSTAICFGDGAFMVGGVRASPWVVKERKCECFVVECCEEECHSNWEIGVEGFGAGLRSRRGVTALPSLPEFCDCASSGLLLE